MASSVDRKSPGIFGVFLGAVLSVALGALLAAIHLAAQPVEVVKALPKEPAPDSRYYVLGAAGSTAGKSWQLKRDALAAGARGGVSLSEADLNAWSESSFEAAKIDDATKNSTVMILAGTPNFRIDGSTFHMGLVNTLNFFGTERPLVMQAQGGFVKGSSGWRFQPEEAMLGALPLHKIPSLLPWVVSRFVAGGSSSAEVNRVLDGASELAVREGALVIAMP